MHASIAPIHKEPSVNQKVRPPNSSIPSKAQLRKSRNNAKLVATRREGKTVFYSLADEHVVLILEKGLEHIRE